MRVAVVGGTGVVGSKVVAQAQRAAVETVVIARSAGVDLVSGDGLDAALTGCDAVIDASNIVTMRARPAVRFFAKATGNLITAAARAGVGHLVALSIVGSDVVDFGYYLGKRAQEDRVRSGEIPWTIVRATQFFEFAEQLLIRMPPLIAAVPRMLCQPAAADDVAAMLLKTAQQHPAREVVAIAGPQQEKMVDMVRRVTAARHLRRLVIPISLPGKVGAAMATGGLLPQGDYVRTTTTFDDYLAAYTQKHG
jgi:uncharacterized protein YbjT (DUF2867 family)